MDLTEIDKQIANLLELRKERLEEQEAERSYEQELKDCVDFRICEETGFYRLDALLNVVREVGTYSELYYRVTI